MRENVKANGIFWGKAREMRMEEEEDDGQEEEDDDDDDDEDEEEAGQGLLGGLGRRRAMARCVSLGKGPGESSREEERES